MSTPLTDKCGICGKTAQMHHLQDHAPFPCRAFVRVEQPTYTNPMGEQSPVPTLGRADGKTGLPRIAWEGINELRARKNAEEDTDLQPPGPGVLEQALVDADNLSTVTNALGIVIDAVPGLPKSRETSIALTHLETALLWLQKPSK